MPSTGHGAPDSPLAARSGRLESFDASRVERSLEGGLRAIHVPDPAADDFVIGMLIRAGTRHESPESAGTSHFLEHLMFRGSRRFPDFVALAEAFERLGGDWNAATGHESTEYWYAGIRHNASHVTDLFAEFLEYPRLRGLDLERAIILRELEGETNEFGHSTDLDLHISRLVWPGSTLAMPILGSPESLDRIRREDLAALRDRLYVPRNMVVWSVGGSPGEDIGDLVARRFSGLRAEQAAIEPPATPPAERFRGPAVRWIENSDNEYEIQLSFVCDGEWSDDAPAYDVLTRVLADGFCSRLPSRLREELGLVYDVDASFSAHSDTGTLDVTASIRGDQFQRFFGELSGILGSLAADGPTPEESERSVMRALVDVELRPSDPARFASRLAWGALCGRRVSLVAERDALRAVTPDRVREVARALFRRSGAALAVLGPASPGLESRLSAWMESGLPGGDDQVRPVSESSRSG